MVVRIRQESGEIPIPHHCCLNCGLYLQFNFTGEEL